MKPPPQKNAGHLKTGTLPKTGQAFDIVLQSQADIAAILDLQHTVMTQLGEEEKSYLVPKDRAFFEKHFASDNIVLGIRVDGQLVAQAVIVNPTAKNPKTGMTDMPGCIKPHKVTVIQGVIVHPAFRGNRLMTEMVDAWLDIARAQGRIHAIAEVTAENHFSWSVFMKEGLQLHSIGYDHDDAVHLYNMHANVKKLITARLAPAFNSSSAKLSPTSIHCPAGNLAQQKKLLAKGFKGVARDSRAGTIIFDKPKGGALRTLLKKLMPCTP